MSQFNDELKKITKSEFQKDFDFLGGVLKEGAISPAPVKRLPAEKNFFEKAVESDQERSEVELFKKGSVKDVVRRTPVLEELPTSNGRHLIKKTDIVRFMAKVETVFRIVFIDSKEYMFSLPVSFISGLGPFRGILLSSILIQYGNEEAIVEKDGQYVVKVNKLFFMALLGDLVLTGSNALKVALTKLQSDGYISIVEEPSKDETEETRLNYFISVDFDKVVKMHIEGLSAMKKFIDKEKKHKEKKKKEKSVDR